MGPSRAHRPRRPVLRVVGPRKHKRHSAANDREIRMLVSVVAGGGVNRVAIAAGGGRIALARRNAGGSWLIESERSGRGFLAGAINCPGRVDAGRARCLSRKGEIEGPIRADGGLSYSIARGPRRLHVNRCLAGGQCAAVDLESAAWRVSRWVHADTRRARRRAWPGS